MAATESPRNSVPLLSLGQAPEFSLDEKADLQNQLLPLEAHLQIEDEEAANLLVISPYTERPHLLDLRTLEPQPALLARALVLMRELRPDYATAPYVDTFNWEEIIANLRQLIAAAGHAWEEQRFFVVVFRSCVPPTTDYGNLGDLDKAAHAEAMASGNFLKYVPSESKFHSLLTLQGTGSDLQIKLVKISPLAFGEIPPTQDLVEWDRLTVELQVLPGPATLSGTLSVSH
jgi:hypothetical protein